MWSKVVLITTGANSNTHSCDSSLHIHTFVDDPMSTCSSLADVIRGTLQIGSTSRFGKDFSQLSANSLMQ